MMRVPRFVNGSGVSFNMTPMIDVVFLLIIFFLVSSHLAKQETQVKLELPRAASGEETVPEPPHVTLNIKSDGQWMWGNRPVSKSRLVELLKQRRAAVGGPLIVRIRGDVQVPYRRVEPVLRACARSGVREVRFAVLPATEAS